ncbi:OmpH family outer membrane protein [Roseovarius sp. M141]|uniref:OmpH family outer membrane protein n=1 Tax=Roseovarius sp. M141 TaxID=2583806 RepID=UPI0020CEA6AE|nr:OmpH family outer membrane protein [Roseovarius sp. M141]MCQ0093062.1 OmpH family outer membrane protein [Roseovarius sp. M141]
MRDATAGNSWASVLMGALALFAGPGVIASGGAAEAQVQDVGTVQSEILTLDPDRLFANTMVGQRLTTQYEAERDRLIASNRELEAELRAEEQALTDAREDMTPKQFRTKADAFDAKVRSIRQENDSKARDLERGREIAPLSLMRMAEPILVQLMRETGGKIILDNRQVLLRADTIDITDLAVARVDATIGDGSGLTVEDGAAALPEAAVPGSDEESPADNAPVPSGDTQTAE